MAIRRTWFLDHELEIDGASSAWIAAPSVGRSSTGGRGVHAHTNPIYLAGAQPLRSAADARFFMDEIDELVGWLDTKGKFDSAQQQEATRELFLRARAIYAEMAGS